MSWLGSGNLRLPTRSCASSERRCAFLLQVAEKIRVALRAVLKLRPTAEVAVVESTSRSILQRAFDGTRKIAQSLSESEVRAVLLQVSSVATIEHLALFREGSPAPLSEVIARPSRVSASGELLPAEVIELSEYVLQFKGAPRGA
jgi:hypothetical protein